VKADVYAFYPTDDTIIDKAHPETKLGALVDMWTRNTYGSGGTNTWECDSLIKFDISSIPSDATIVSAELKIYYYFWMDSNPAGRPLNLYRITSDWNEETLTWNNQPSIASHPTTNAIVPSSYGWMNWDVTDDVQSFIDGTNPNYGWEIKDETYWGASNIPYTFFKTKENGSNIPYLLIEIASPDVVYVDDDYTTSTPGWQIDCFDVIQDGIEVVSEGGTVNVYNGIYYENVIIDKTINLIGENRENTIIDGGGSGNVVFISADWVSISGFCIQYSQNSVGYSGIRLESDYSSIIDNKFSNNRHGVFLYSSNNNNIRDNNFNLNIERAITLKYSCNNNIFNNVLTNHAGSSLVIDVYSCNNNAYRNIITNNNRGIAIDDWSNYNIITNNLIKGNNIEGIHLTDYCEYNSIIENDISNNLCGIALRTSSNSNKMYHNNFINNINNNWDEGSNTWDNGYPSGGNYFDDYAGNDNYHGPNQDIPGPDVLGDIPYSISGGSNQDNYPLMKQWTSEPPFLDISIDIKPGDYPNTINPKSKGKLTVAILTTENFDASYVNPDSIDFLSASPSKSTMDDVDEDGDVDMILHFKTQELNFNLLVDEGDEYPYAYLTGETNYGDLIEGKDTIRLVGQTFLQQMLEEFFEKLIHRFPFLDKILNLILI
jgi:parallel beta-helix repeat protein